MATVAPQRLDEAKLEAFMGKLIGDFGGTMAVQLAALGDRLGLWKELAKAAATPSELAQRAGIHERYAREWLQGVAAAGYVERDGDRFVLPPENVEAFAHEAGPFFVGGMLEMLPAMMDVFPAVERAFREGGGVAQDEYDPKVWEGMERFSAGWIENLLLAEWLPAVPHVREKLERGARLGDVGCGSGRAIVKLAREYPRSTFVGYDAFPGQLERAGAAAAEAGLDNVRFELLDAAAGLPERFDVVTTFDVVHDAVDPRGLLRAIRESLDPDGSYLCLEINAADDPAENVGPLAAMFYGASVSYCLTTSLAHGGEGLGTLGLPERTLRELATGAGFASVHRLPIENPFNTLYELRS